MSLHSVHPPILEHGLADGCPRCAELAAHPYGLDRQNANALLDRFQRGLPWRSMAERAAFMQCRIEQLASMADSLELKAADALRDGDAEEAAIYSRSAGEARAALPQARRDRLDAIWDMADAEAEGVAS